MRYSKNINDNFITPSTAWLSIKNLLDEYVRDEMTIWEPFYLDGSSGDDLRNMGYNVIHTDEDFFECNHGEIIVTNPPFSKKKEILQRLKQLEKPFILLAPLNMLSSVYFREAVYELPQNVKVVIPRRRIEFLALKDGIVQEVGRPSFDCVFYCVGPWPSGVEFSA